MRPQITVVYCKSGSSDFNNVATDRKSIIYLFIYLLCVENITTDAWCDNDVTVKHMYNKNYYVSNANQTAAYVKGCCYPSSPSPKGAQPPIFDPCPLWTDGRMD